MKDSYVQRIMRLYEDEIERLQAERTALKTKLFGYEALEKKLVGYQYQDDQQRAEITRLTTELHEAKAEQERLRQLGMANAVAWGIDHINDEELREIWNKNHGPSPAEETAQSGLRPASEATDRLGDGSE